MLHLKQTITALLLCCITFPMLPAQQADTLQLDGIIYNFKIDDAQQHLITLSAREKKKKKNKTVYQSVLAAYQRESLQPLWQIDGVPKYAWFETTGHGVLLWSDRVRMYDYETGTPIWELPANFRPCFIAQNRLIGYGPQGALDTNRLQAISLLTGKEVWHTKIPHDGGWSRVQYLSEDKCAIVADRLHIIDLRHGNTVDMSCEATITDGKRLAGQILVAVAAAAASVAVSGGTLYTIVMPNASEQASMAQLIAPVMSDGSHISGLCSNLLQEGDSFYFADRDDIFYLDGANLKAHWKTPLPRRRASHSVLFCRADTLYMINYGIGNKPGVEKYATGRPFIASLNKSTGEMFQYQEIYDDKKISLGSSHHDESGIYMLFEDGIVYRTYADTTLQRLPLDNAEKSPFVSILADGIRMLSDDGKQLIPIAHDESKLTAFNKQAEVFELTDTTQQLLPTSNLYKAYAQMVESSDKRYHYFRGGAMGDDCILTDSTYQVLDQFPVPMARSFRTLTDGQAYYMAQGRLLCYTPKQLPQITKELKSPLLFSDGIREVTNESDWAERRAEIGQLIQDTEIGIIPQVAPEQIKARMAHGQSGDTIYVTVQVSDSTLTLWSEIQYPSTGDDGPYPLLIGASMISLPHELLDTLPIARLNYHEAQVNAYSQFRPDRDTVRSHYGFVHLYPSLIGNGAYSEWIWGFSRIIDGLMQLGPEQTRIDCSRIGVTGCSYAGKMALFCGAFDERVCLTIAQEPGGGGAAAWRTSHELQGVEDLDHTDYNWFKTSLRDQYGGDRVYLLPYDHHELCAMVAPRSLLVLGNPDFQWLADPSAYASMQAARPIWQKLGVDDRWGIDIVGNHPHCQLPKEQYNLVYRYLKAALQF